VREADNCDRDWMLERLRERWGESATIVAAGRRHDLSELPALVALSDGDPVGVATYQLDGDQCELVTLDAFAERRGVGPALLDGVAALARARGCRRL
jgi:GNAT superfamily N-acetyltransferase